MSDGSPYYDQNGVSIFHGDSLEVLRGMDAESVNCCVTSPPYWGLRDYGEPGQLGLESTPEEYTAKMVELFAEVRRVLRDDGTVWLNLGDSYAHSLRQSGAKHAGNMQNGSKGTIRQGFKPNCSGLKEKNLVGIPWRVAFALQSDGWYLRQDIIWHKPNPMPESVRDRCTKAHEYIFLLSKSKKYFYDAEAIKEQSTDKESHNGRRTRHTRKDHEHKVSAGNHDREFVGERRGMLKGKMNDAGRKYPTKNKRSVWTVTPKPYKGAHFATFPPDLIEPCILAGCPEGGTVLDPFMGSGTTGQVARDHGLKAIGIELNAEYIDLAAKRLGQEVLF